jgi:hypothetical protein
LNTKLNRRTDKKKGLFSFPVKQPKPLNNRKNQEIDDNIRSIIGRIMAAIYLSNAKQHINGIELLGHRQDASREISRTVPRHPAAAFQRM